MFSKSKVEQVVRNVKNVQESNDSANEIGGFWNAIKNMDRYDLIKSQWNRAFIALKSNFAQTDDKTLRNFLDSQYGRAFADLAIQAGLSYEFVIQKMEREIKKQLEIVAAQAYLFED